MSHSLPDFRRRSFQRVFYMLLILIADFLEDHLGLFRDLRPQRMPSKAAEWTTEEVLEKADGAGELDEAGRGAGDSPMSKIDDATAGKWIYGISDEGPYAAPEVLAMQCVLDNTTIPTPRLHSVASYPDSTDACMVMDYIPGTRLDQVWPTLSLFSKLRIAWILRSYVRQLRRIRHPRSNIPGSLGPGLVARGCKGVSTVPISTFGPFADPEELTATLNKKCSSYLGAPIPDAYTTPEQLVFTHNDLHMRNILLGHDGRVWLIDWGLSGFYPRSFEFTSAVIMSERSPHDVAPLSWRRCLPFIADPYFGRYRWLMGHAP
ncbi:kinase-like protein [Phanerochaete sordida]|uniref:Kinase-like protein n=1 Tax=Phanerochaete sordida TaxID=48140 RepID=A0A9P3GFM0_9APHY|nr:kinase-like protein [Phanerochaete sordida]